MATIAQPLARHRTKSALARREAIEGLLYISPFLLGFLIFTAYPMIASFYLSFTKYNILNPPTWIGLENYQEAFFKDEQFWNSLRRTGVFALLNVTLGVIGSLGAALLLNQRFRGTTVFRTFFFLPSITSCTASSILSCAFGQTARLGWGLALPRAACIAGRNGRLASRALFS